VIDYGNAVHLIPKRRFGGLKKKTPPVPNNSPLPLAEKKPVELEIEEGELIEEREMSEADKKACDELYGDLI
jgi:hypothetical protein